MARRSGSFSGRASSTDLNAGLPGMNTAGAQVIMMGPSELEGTPTPGLAMNAHDRERISADMSP